MAYFKLSVQEMIDNIRREIVDEDSSNYRWSNDKLLDALNSQGLKIAMKYLCIEGVVSLTSPTLSGVAHTEADFKISLPDEFLKMQSSPWYYDGSKWYEIEEEILRKGDLADLILSNGETNKIPDYFYLSDAWDYLWIYPAAPSGKTIKVYANLKPTLLTSSGMDTTYSELPAVMHDLQWLLTAHNIASWDRQIEKQAVSIAERYKYQEGIVDSLWGTKTDKASIIKSYTP